jgi:phosphopantetheinyl transferase (holo-ACP synthase)
MPFYVGLSLLGGNDIADNSAGALHRRQTREGRRILTLLDQKAGVSPENHIDIDERIAIESGGRPFFTGGHADFSISHSGAMVAVVYARGGPLPRTGCDVQQADTRRSRDEVIKRFYHDEERRYIEAAPSPLERSLRFFRIWVLKEAYLKMRGFSVGDIAGTPVFSPNAETPGFRTAKDAEAKTLNFYLSEWGDEPPRKYMLAVCLDAAGKNAGPPEALWLSEERLASGSWLTMLPGY